MLASKVASRKALPDLHPDAKPEQGHLHCQAQLRDAELNWHDEKEERLLLPFFPRNDSGA